MTPTFRSWFALYKACRQDGFRLPGPLSRQRNGGEARIRDRIPADLRADLLFTKSLTPRTIMRLTFCSWRRERKQTRSLAFILAQEKSQIQAGYQPMALEI
ncbi:hypothetical protein PoB_002399700 [Plakobranchus ocellatus]|uniref:Uncharacterized protein n=1 Tax=Plakobranchus ocellatus TaxID=259542 RepID=A0AAV3ZSF8_9GAST|nr:hypothetical protein PoB_002399700 [Plakobranchus ocellatus]